MHVTRTLAVTLISCYFWRVHLLQHEIFKLVLLNRLQDILTLLSSVAWVFKHGCIAALGRFKMHCTAPLHVVKGTVGLRVNFHSRASILLRFKHVVESTLFSLISLPVKQGLQQFAVFFARALRLTLVRATCHNFIVVLFCLLVHLLQYVLKFNLRFQLFVLILLVAFLLLTLKFLSFAHQLLLYLDNLLVLLKF